MLIVLLINIVISVSCGEPYAGKMASERSDLKYDYAHDNGTTTNDFDQGASCLHNDHKYRNGDFWLNDELYYTCLDSAVALLSESCDRSDEGFERESYACATVEDLRRLGVSIPDFSELHKLNPLDETGVLGGARKSNKSKDLLGEDCAIGESRKIEVNHGIASYLCENKKWVLENLSCNQNDGNFTYTKIGNTCERQEIQGCANGSLKESSIEYGEIRYKCQNFSWKIDSVNCAKDSDRYVYYRSGNRCRRRNQGECTFGQRKEKSIQYGKVKYKCSNSKWKVDKVSCDKSTKGYTYKVQGSSCKREKRRSCTSIDNGILYHGDSKSKRISNGKIIIKCDNGKTKKSVNCNIGYRKSGSDKCVRYGS